MEKERNVRTNMGAIAQTKLGQVIKGAFSAFIDMVNFEEIDSVDEAVNISNRDNPEEMKQNEKIAEALNYQTQSAEKRVDETTLDFSDKNKLDYIKVEKQKEEPQKMTQRQETYQQATKEEQQK